MASGCNIAMAIVELDKNVQRGLNYVFPARKAYDGFPVEGMKARVTGYPDEIFTGKKRPKLEPNPCFCYSMEGNMSEILVKNNGSHALALYTKIVTSSGQAGAALQIYNENGTSL